MLTVLVCSGLQWPRANARPGFSPRAIRALGVRGSTGRDLFTRPARHDPPYVVRLAMSRLIALGRTLDTRPVAGGRPPGLPVTGPFICGLAAAKRARRVKSR